MSEGEAGLVIVLLIGLCFAVVGLLRWAVETGRWKILFFNSLQVVAGITLIVILVDLFFFVRMMKRRRLERARR